MEKNFRSHAQLLTLCLTHSNEITILGSVIYRISGVGKICLRIIQKFYFIQIYPNKDVQTSLILGRRFLLVKNIFFSEKRKPIKLVTWVSSITNTAVVSIRCCHEKTMQKMYFIQIKKASRFQKLIRLNIIVFELHTKS